MYSGSNSRRQEEFLSLNLGNKAVVRFKNPPQIKNKQNPQCSNEIEFK